ncbi:PP2C family protein-serine/threonine phosphatase [Edaphobacter sp. HDX4]|uniref:PP2C family protein-serine/threonine phosphatase n=1 Tax=Edaphobacter sp. HDX4 TaxID=2794064 RepID=UPI002FE56741
MSPMNTVDVDSLAFRKALLESECRRIYGVTTFLLVFTAAIVVRGILYSSHMSMWGTVILLLLVAYEAWTLGVVRRALRGGRDLPAAMWMFNIVLEIAAPAVGVAYFSNPLLGEYRAIETPWVLAFFPLIMLSVLRLNPLVSRIAGAAAAVGYLVAAYIDGWRPSLESLSHHTVAQTAVAFYAAILLASGLIAGMIGSEITKHVKAALHEAEMTRQLKEVEHDLEIARSIQQSLLPTIRPTIRGMEISGWNLPADATGGDYFDWKRMRDGRLVVTLADVTGHGIGPALLASVCRAYARSSFDTHDNLVKALEHVNQFFGEDLIGGGRFATFVAAVCSADESRVELLSAGHGPLFVYSSVRDSFEELAAQAIPLGLLPELNSSEPVTLHMEVGDMVVLATDGFFEWENAESEQFGVARLTQAVRNARHLPSEQIIAELYSAVKAFADGTKQVDDLTAVVIKRVDAETGKPLVV